jgi:hypothetical protein
MLAELQIDPPSMAKFEARAMSLNPVPSTVEPVVVRPDTACQMLDCGPTRLYQLINERQLDSFADGRRRYITTESIYRYIASRLAQLIKSPAGSTEKATAASVASPHRFKRAARRAARERRESTASARVVGGSS